MAGSINNTPSRITERLLLLLLTVIFGLLFYPLINVLKKDFKDVPARMADGTMMNINDARPGQQINTLLTRGFYFSDPRDIRLISEVVEKVAVEQPGVTDNIGELNKSKYSISADDAYRRGGESFQKRVKVSRALLGFSETDTALFEKERRQPMQVPAVQQAGMGRYSINGNIANGQAIAVANVLVRLRLILPKDSMHFTDLVAPESKITTNKNGLHLVQVRDSANIPRLESLVAFARTDSRGNFSFAGLPDGKAFEVLPLQPGYQFGASKGVETLTGDRQFSFRQAPHTIRLFSNRDFSNFKKEKSFIVRSPGEAMQWCWIIATVFIVAFWLLHLILSIRFVAADQMVLPVLMLLSGFSILTLLSLQDPLRDRFLARSTLGYFGAGMGAILVLLLFNLRRFTTDSFLYRLGFFKQLRTAANGWPWAVAAIALLTLTIIFGTGPEGSGVKVNLLGFQPSEIVKFMVLLFLAGFFAMNEKFIAEYATWGKRFSFFALALVAIGCTILLFLILGDLGPAMVCCFTFIILFSFSRGDFAPMIGAIVIYVLSIWISNSIWWGTGITIVVLTGYMLIRKKKMSESTVMATGIIAGFLLLDKIPYLATLFPGPIKRLVDRKAIWEDPWNNEVFGGDQVANGIWAMSGGGVSGQGVGEGFAKTIPEAHTDMILPSFGEEFGWAGIVCIFILFLLYLHRSIVIGRQTGAPFLFYLCAGIGIATFIQFLLIAGGSTGALPLTGVALPFISYGGSSLFCNLVAAGFLLSASHLKGTPAQMKFITARQDKNLVPALLAACIAIVLLSVNVATYILKNKQWVVEPALVADRSGQRMFSYNPRINILMNRLQAGNLLDRNGRLLATSQHASLMKQQDSLRALGFSDERIASFAYKRADRYYPFGDHMFFWTGDANTGVFNGSSNGYFAEYVLGPALRGFETPQASFEVSATRFRENRFLPQTSTEMSVSKRDYSALSHLLLAGINSPAVQKFRKRNRDVKVTMDAALQTAIQQSIAADDSANTKRTSVVIIEDNTGEVLTSAVHPLPPVDNWDQLILSEPELNKLPGINLNADIGFTHATQPGSTAKLVTSLAAFNKLGDAAAKKNIRIYPQDLIRVKSDEPDEAGLISMERAIVRSNNSYFIRLANEDALQEEMGTIYLQTGMFLHGVGGYYYDGQTAGPEQQEKWRAIWRKTEFASARRYNRNNIRRTRAIGISGMAWGQGELVATPASVARLAAGIANQGQMMNHRYVKEISGVDAKSNGGIQIAGSPSYAGFLTDYMRKQSAPKIHRLGILVAGKTGTPERVLKGETINDGWYVFFAPKPGGIGHIVVCVRIENARGSSEAVKLAGKHVVPLLLQRGYIKGFEPPARPIGNKKAVLAATAATPAD